jgi:cell division protein FtsB
MKGIKESVQFIRSKMNKYWIAVIIGVAVTFVFGEYNIVERTSNYLEIRRLQSEIKHYTQLKEADQQKLQELHSDSESLEKLAREEYKMIKPDEEMFIITE